VSDEIYLNLTGPDAAAPDSVHLSDWPTSVEERRDDELRKRMQLVRSLVGLGRAARTDAKVKVRQPLARALVVIPSADAELLTGLETLIAEELNVKSIEPMSGIEELVTYTVKPNFKALGPRFGPKVKDVASALTGADATALVHSLESDGTVRLEVAGSEESFTADELDIRVDGRSGFSLAQEGAYGVALDLDITPELRAEGIAREVVRAIQDLRKDTGLAVEDRIELWLTWDSDVAGAAMAAHATWIAGEVLATTTHLGEEPLGDTNVDHVDVDHGRVVVGIRKP
jgi:isoleucyl-tRNA synthetase